jgi:hypothetical protein
VRALFSPALVPGEGHASSSAKISTSAVKCGIISVVLLYALAGFFSWKFKSLVLGFCLLNDHKPAMPRQCEGLHSSSVRE